MNPISKYLQETRAELRHVAWPTQTQTIVYTVLVALLSLGVSLYLGLFDFIFTTTLTRVISALPSSGVEVTQQPVPTTPTTGTTQTAPLAPVDNGGSTGGSFNIVPGATNKAPAQN